MDETRRQATRLWTVAQPTVSAFVTSVIRDFKDRDDVLQDIAVAAIESFDAYDTGRPFVPWVMGVARNQVGLYLRRRRRDRLTFDQETVELLATAFSEVTPLQRQRLDALADCLVRLSQLAVDLGDLIAALDINPLMVLPAGGGVRAVDALVEVIFQS